MSTPGNTTIYTIFFHHIPSVSLFISVPPYIEISHSELDLKVIKGRPVRFRCPAMGIPDPNITWYKGDVQLEAGQRVTFISNNHLMEISGTHEQDTGQYSCSAENVAGETSKRYKLTVQGIIC